MRIINNLLSIDPGETYNIRKELNGKTVKSVSRKTLVIHATEGADVAGAVNWLQPPPLKGTLKGELSIHLVVGKDGREIVQMVPFDKGAQHAGSDYNVTSIGIELDYPSLLTEKTGKFNSMDKYTPNQYILAKNLNGKDYNFWPLYPRDQLDALVVISKTLIDTYGITDVVGHEEFYSGKQDPGPAFPIIQFREKLLGPNERSMVLQETTREVTLRNEPAQNSVLVSASHIPAGTPVAVVNEKDDCYLIAVIAEIDGNPWLTGWVDKSAVQIKRNAPLFVQEDHYLSTLEGRRFQVIEPDPANYDSSPKFAITNHKYIIMHITTGTRMESTINTFRNPASGVSSHLLIGREGQVVQFLPFNKIAWHAGYSWWEGDSSLNSFSIGIELDNAGPLEKNETGQWVPLHKKIVIPDDKVQLAQHWKETRERGWEKFTD
ncbi:MAG: N-acetylmuramoyl-L-alanine amidase, partial [Chloroflexi bacterium]|nr:N-acetylmuramoyl-L-alanine amidase [Chloroflexota bacterium]